MGRDGCEVVIVWCSGLDFVELVVEDVVEQSGNPVVVVEVEDEVALDGSLAVSVVEGKKVYQDGELSFDHLKLLDSNLEAGNPVHMKGAGVKAVCLVHSQGSN